MTRTPRRPARRAAIGVGLTLPAVLATVAATVAPTATAGPAAEVTITVDAAHPGRVIPRDFVGLSFEADQLHRTWTDPRRGNAAALLRNLRVGNLRFSANQVDNTAWMPDPAAPTPAWAINGQRIVPADLSRVGRLAAATGWSVDLGVNLGHFDPAAAANQAAAAHALIGAGLRSIQIGNEPNAYALLALSSTRRPYDPASYVRDVAVYRTAIRAAAPGIPIEGPDTAGGAVGVPPIDDAAYPRLVAPWLTAYSAAFGASVRFLNTHYYPYVNVTRLGVPAGTADAVGALPTVDRLLSPATTAKQVVFLRQFAATARGAGLAPRLTETNSVAKEGREGVTNSFGAALWTVDYLLTAAQEGIVGVNLHNQVDDCQSYPLFCFPDAAARRRDAARVNPNYYAALLVSQMSGGALLPTTTTGRAHVTAHAVRAPDGTVKVAVTNLERAFRGRVTVAVTGADGTATVQRLTGPSITAVQRTRFAGSAVGADGSFRAGPGAPITASNGRLRLLMDRPGAALLTVR